MMKRSQFSQQKSWTLYGQKFENYDKFKKAFAGSLCGKLQMHLQSLRTIEKNVMNNSVDSNRDLFLKTCIDLKSAIHDTLNNKEWKQQIGRSMSRRYLLGIDNELSKLVKVLSWDDCENLREEINSIANALIRIIPPRALTRAFCTVQLKKGTKVKVDESEFVTLEAKCSVACLIKLIGKCMSSQEFLSNVDEPCSVPKNAKSSVPDESECPEVSSSDKKYSERSHSRSYSSEDSSSEDSSSYISEYWHNRKYSGRSNSGSYSSEDSSSEDSSSYISEYCQSEDTPRPNPGDYSQEHYYVTLKRPVRNNGSGE